MQKTFYKKIEPYVLSLPALLVLIGILYPFGLGVYYSLTSKTLAYMDEPFIGLQNYIDLFTGIDFWHSISVTLQYAFGATAVQMSLGFLVAYYLDKFEVGWVKSFLIVPFMVPPVIGAMIWKVMLRPGKGGIINRILSFANLGPFSFLSSTELALPSVIMIDTWIFTPFVILILFAGIRSVSKNLIEAAKIDGASEFHQITKIIIPSMKTHLLIALTFRFIDSLKLFDIIFTATKGGPASATSTLHVEAYFTTIRGLDLGFGMPYLVILWLLCFLSARFLVSRW